MPEQSTYHFSYAISKQLPTAHSLNSSYGKLELDEEMRAAIEKALLPILEKRLNAPLELEKGIPELSPEPDPNPSPVDKVLAFYKSALLEKNTNALKNM